MFTYIYDIVYFKMRMFTSKWECLLQNENVYFQNRLLIVKWSHSSVLVRTWDCGPNDHHTTPRGIKLASFIIVGVRLGKLLYTTLLRFTHHLNRYLAHRSVIELIRMISHQRHQCQPLWLYANMRVDIEMELTCPVREYRLWNLYSPQGIRTLNISIYLLIRMIISKWY